MASGNGGPPWQSVFIEACVRAMRRLHLERQVENVARSGDSLDAERAGELNNGPGIELMDERVVCNFIWMEHMNSPLNGRVWSTREQGKESRAGGKQDESQPESDLKSRTYEIKIEEGYPDNPKQHCDFWVRKVGTEKPCWIEAKRVRRWWLEGTVTNSSVPPVAKQQRASARRRRVRTRCNISGIVEDACKLSNSEACGFKHLLLWSVYDESCGTKDEQTPDTVVQSVCKELCCGPTLDIGEVRWIPLSLPKRERPCEREKVARPEVTRWLWVALVEVDKGRRKQSCEPGLVAQVEWSRRRHGLETRATQTDTG